MTTRKINTVPTLASATEQTEDKERRFFAATRHGKKPVTVFLEAEDHRRLKRLAVDTGDTMQELMAEAIADLFSKRGG